MRAWSERGLPACLVACLFALLTIAWPAGAWAQTAPVDPGQLLEQQRRLEQQRQPAPTPRATLDLPTPEAMPSRQPGDALFTVKRFKLEGQTLFDDAALQAVVQPWLMRPIGLADLRQAVSALTRHYRDTGWLVEVGIPPQDVTEGEVRLVLAEAQVGRVVLQAAEAPQRSVDSGAGRASAPDPQLLAHVQALVDAQMPAGQALNLQALERALLLADELPGVRVSGSLQAGAAPGSTDVVVQLVPRPAREVQISADNAASRATGSERLSAQVTFNAPLGRGDQFGLSLSKTRGSDYLGGSASLPVGVQGWRLAARASTLRYQVLDGMNTTTGLAPAGDSLSLGLELRVPLVRTALSRWNASAGVEHRRQRASDDVQTLNVRSRTQASRNQVLSLAVSGYHFDRIGQGGQTEASAQLSLGQLSLADSPASFRQADAATAATEGGYEKLRVQVSRLQVLTTKLSLQATLTGQLATGNLDASEKLYLGGVGGVTAYPSGEAGGSSGHLLNLSLRQQISPKARVSAFVDWGQVRQFAHNARADGNGPLLAQGNQVTLKGVGVSAAYNPKPGVQLQATLARRIGSNPLATPTGRDTDGSLHKNRLWVSASLAF